MPTKDVLFPDDHTLNYRKASPLCSQFQSSNIKKLLPIACSPLFQIMEIKQIADRREKQEKPLCPSLGVSVCGQIYLSKGWISTTFPSRSSSGVSAYGGNKPF